MAHDDEGILFALKRFIAVNEQVSTCFVGFEQFEIVSHQLAELAVMIAKDELNPAL